MYDRSKRAFQRALLGGALLAALLPLGVIVSLLFFHSGDISANRTEERVIFGALAVIRGAGLSGRFLVCVGEIVLCLGVIGALNFYYTGVALLVLTERSAGTLAMTGAGEEYLPGPREA